MYSSAISAFHLGFNGIKTGSHPLISDFLSGARHIRPPPVVLPQWSLHPVLMALTEHPWEPLHLCDLKMLTLKTAFLVAIASARRVSELQALCTDEVCYKFVTQDILQLRTNVAFMPKCKSEFHRAQSIVLKSFKPDAKTTHDKKLHKMCPVRALKYYRDRTKGFREDNTSTQLFRAHAPGLNGKPVSKATISRWIVETIKTCYEQQNLDPPKSLRAHGTRSQAASWAAFAGVDPARICKAACWTNLHTFCSHYRLAQLWENEGISDQVLGAAAESSYTVVQMS